MEPHLILSNLPLISSCHPPLFTPYMAAMVNQICASEQSFLTLFTAESDQKMTYKVLCSVSRASDVVAVTFLRVKHLIFCILVNFDVLMYWGNIFIYQQMMKSA